MNYNLTDMEASKQICDIGRRLYERGLIGGVDGNISCRVAENEVWITPTMSCKGFLTPNMLVKIDLDGNPLLPDQPRTSSETLMHLVVYRDNPQIQAIVHAHPSYATIMATIGKDIPADLLAEGVYFFGDTLHVAPFAQPGTAELGTCVLPFCKRSSAVLLANHGALTWGSSLMDAFIAMESVENYCRVYLHTQYIVGSHTEIPEENKKRLGRMRPA